MSQDRGSIPPPNERPTMQQLATQANGQAPWTCPKCGCRDWRVLDTVEATGGNVRRTRYCRHCGKGGPRIYTIESPYKVLDVEDDGFGETDCA